MSDAEKTPTESPLSLAVARIERKLDDLRSDISLIRLRTDKALEISFAAHQTAKAALFARTSWGPYVVSALAFALAAVAVFGR
jgi:hypothetical protein